ncbi:MAG: hypothetical protein U1F72_00590 [Gammaproteobacteria bacterium]
MCPASTDPLDAETLARCRRKALRTAWLLGGGVVLLYLLGFLIPR